MHSGARRQYLIWGPCLVRHKLYSGVPNTTSVPSSVNDMACFVSPFTALTDLISWYRTIYNYIIFTRMCIAYQHVFPCTYNVTRSVDNDGVERTRLYACDESTAQRTGYELNQFVLDIRAQILRCRSCRTEWTNRACIATSARKFPPCQQPSPTCSRCPRNARLIMASVMNLVYYPKQTLSPEGRFCRDCLFLDAINALTRLPSPECDARIKVRLGFSRVI